MKKVNLILCIAGFASLTAITAIAQDTVEDSSQTDTKWYKMADAQKLAQENDRKVLIFAEASWCSYCKRMKQEVFPEADIQKTTTTYFYPVKVDIESVQLLEFNGEEMTEMQFSRQMRVSGTPTFFFIDEEGTVIGAQPGFIPKDTYKALLSYIGTETYNQVEFKDYLNGNK